MATPEYFVYRTYVEGSFFGETELIKLNDVKYIYIYIYLEKDRDCLSF